MSEADRVFARMTPPGSHPAPEDKQLLHIAPRGRGATSGQGRTVEVVHRRSDRPAAARPGRPSAHAETWPEGFQARSAAPPEPAGIAAAAPDAAPPVGHVMPGWTPLLPPAAASPAPSPSSSPSSSPSGAAPRQPKARALPEQRRRAFADPFAAGDAGTNCRRCGYLVQPARERRGLLTCARCG